MPRRECCRNKALIKEFLQVFCKEVDGRLTCVYGNQLKRLTQRKQTLITIDLDDVAAFHGKLSEAIAANGRFYLRMFRDVIFHLISKNMQHEVRDQAHLDVYIEQNLKKRQSDQPNNFSTQIIKKFEVNFKSHSSCWAKPFHEIKQEHYGKLIIVEGIVSRCGEVKPVEVMATYSCNFCCAETYQPAKSFSFIPIQKCLPNYCRTNKTKGRMQLKAHSPELIEFQELIILEHKETVSGQVPRIMVIWCRNYAAQDVQLGDHIVVGGLYLPFFGTKLRSEISCRLIASFISVKLTSQIDATT